MPDNCSCSFCGKSAKDVMKLVEGPEIYICDECIEICYNIVHTPEEPPKAEPAPIPSPHEIKAHLDEYVIGQDQAKLVVSVAVYNHYKRINDSGKDDTELEKSNILLIGPSAVGKTRLAQTIAKMLDVPFVIADATTLTETGYVGEDVESIISRLLQAANYDVGQAERGIIFIDEVDKLRKRTGGAATKDIGGEGVQQALLKLLEGSDVIVPSNGRRGPNSEMIKVDTRNILFICGGAFSGIEELTNNTEAAGIGFGSKLVDRSNMAYGEVEPDHLARYGMIPEFIGRLPVMTTLSELDEGQLVRVLTEPKNSLVRQFEKLFLLDGVKLVFEPEALREIARAAKKMKTGARGLRGVMEKALLTLQFDLPTMAKDGVYEVCINADVIAKNSAPIVKKRRRKKKTV